VTETTSRWSRRRRRRSTTRTILLLLALALLIRLVVVVVAAGAKPTDSVSDSGYHARLLHDPIGHLEGNVAAVDQYAPYLGVAEWITAKPWVALGAGDLTALRLGSVVWDLAGMAILLAGIARWRPRCVLLAGLIWAVAPVMWPASAFAAQDEPFAAAIVAAAVVLVIRRHRRAALVLLVFGCFAAKVLLGPVVLAFLLTAPRATRRREWITVAVTAVGLAAVTWVVSGSDGLSQQFGYTPGNIGFSMTPWSTLVLHHVVTVNTANRTAIVLAGVAIVGVVALWSRHREDGEEGGYRLAAALLLACFALLAVSNPEYLCVVMPLAIVASTTIEGLQVPWGFLVVATLAWAVDLVYYFLRRAYDPTGTLLGRDGFQGDLSGSVRVLDAVHQALLLFLLVAVVVVAWRWAAGPLSGEVDASSPRRRAIPVRARARARADQPVDQPTSGAGVGTADSSASAVGTLEGAVEEPAHTNRAVTVAMALVLIGSTVAALIFYTVAVAIVLGVVALVFLGGAFFVDRDY